MTLLLWLPHHLGPSLLGSLTSANIPRGSWSLLEAVTPDLYPPAAPFPAVWHFLRASFLFAVLDSLSLGNPQNQTSP